MKRRRGLRAGALVAIGTLCAVGAAVVPGGVGGAQTEPSAVQATADAVPGEYVVTLRPTAAGNVPGFARSLTARYGGDVLFVYEHAYTGFAVAMSDEQAEQLARHPLVEAVTQNGVARVDATQSNPPWGLDRVDDAFLPLDLSYVYDATGAGVTAYIIDTGIRTAHTQFGGRAVFGVDKVGDGQPAGSDCNGHGTHVAGTIGGSTYGVAKAVNLVAVRVLGCGGSGTWAGVIAGVDWVTSDHPVRPGPAVANMSLGGGSYAPLNTAVTNSINSGVTYAIAAGNSNANACNYSPASVPSAITVGATTNTDARASYSNFGTCLDIFAPGSGILSSWGTGDTATNTISGTSMATPHVAGVAALYLSKNASATPATVTAAIVNNSVPNVVTGAGTGSPNRLLYSPFVDGIPPTTTTTTTTSTTSTTTTTTTAPVPPGAPKDLEGSGARKAVQLTWTKPDGVAPTGYRVYRSTNGSPFMRVTTLGAVTSWKNNGLKSDQTYWYYVTAMNGTAEGPASNTVSVKAT